MRGCKQTANYTVFMDVHTKLSFLLLLLCLCFFNGEKLSCDNECNEGFLMDGRVDGLTGVEPALFQKNNTGCFLSAKPIAL